MVIYRTAQNKKPHLPRTHIVLPAPAPHPHINKMGPPRPTNINENMSGPRGADLSAQGSSGYQCSLVPSLHTKLAKPFYRLGTKVYVIARLNQNKQFMCSNIELRKPPGDIYVLTIISSR